MPQLENGHTRIANELLEAFAKIRIPGEAMQILFVIIRKTYGFQKKSDCIPLSQLQSATGLKRSSVCRAIKKLLAMNIITSDKKVTSDSYEKVTSKTARYSINKHYETWVASDKKVTSHKKVTTTSHEKVNKLVTIKLHSKEIQKKNTKENIPAQKSQEEKKPNAWAIWIDINRELGRADPFASGKDTKAAKSILSQIQDPEKFKDILRQYLTDDDRFLMQNGHSISLLSSRINKYLNQSYKSMYDDEQGCDDAIIEAIEAECWAKNPELMKRQQEEYEETIARMKREREEKAEELRKLKEELI